MELHSRILGEGKPFIILHGFLGMGDNWKTIGRQFSQNGFQVHLVDQRNHGKSFHDNAFSYQDMVADLQHYVLHNNLDRFVLLGHSMGGKTAMLYACDYPEMVDKLVVADIGPKLYPQHHQLILESLQRLSVDQEALSSRKNADAFLLHYIKDTGVRMFLLKNLFWEEPGKLGLRVNLEVLIENIEEIGKPLDISKSFDGSTLFLKGERSNYIQPQDENDIYNAFAKAQIKEIPKAGHWLHAENPTEFFREVMNFV